MQTTDSYDPGFKQKCQFIFHVGMCSGFVGVHYTDPAVIKTMANHWQTENIMAVLITSMEHWIVRGIRKT